MIRSFRDKDTLQVFETGRSRKFGNVAKSALKRLDYIEAAKLLDDLKVPPGNRLEALVGDREGQHSIRINDQYRICFEWKEDGAYDVEITDYHH